MLASPTFTLGTATMNWLSAMTLFWLPFMRFAALAGFLGFSSIAVFAPALAGPDQQVVIEPTTFRIGEHLIQGDRGRLLVKENRRRADSRSIEIAFVRFRHPEAGPDAPIVYLPGGPGQPVLGQVDHFAITYQNYLNIGGRGDMLVVEQRGIGASRPRLDCPGVLSRPVDMALSASVMGSTHKRYIEQCLDHWTGQGVDPGGYNVVSMADDIDELREGLGYEKLKLVGESFGSHHALAVIGKHGDRVERAVLSGVIGPNDMFEMPATVERQLAKVERWTLDGNERGGSLSMTSILDGLDRPQSVRVPTGRGDLLLEVGRYDLALAAVTLSRQTAFLQELPRLYGMVAEGDLSWLAGWSAKIRDGHPSNLASLLITCASGASAARRAAIKAEAADSRLGDAVDLLGADACSPVANLELGENFRRPVSIDIPILMMSGELDPRAPPSNAEAILPGLPRGHHVVFPGVSHDFGHARQAQLDLAYRFLAHGETQPNAALIPKAKR